MVWQIFGKTIETNDNSPRTVELLRLKCFQDMLNAIGFKTSLQWEDTRYSLSIKKRFSLIQKITKEIEPKKPEKTLKWESPTDCYTECALTFMYRGALKCAADYLGVSLELPSEVNQRLNEMKNCLPTLLSSLRLFPINSNYTDHSYNKNGTSILEVLCGAQLTDEDLKTVDFIWPGLKLHYANPKDYQHLHKYIDQFIEYHLESIRTPYAHFSVSHSYDELIVS